METCAASRLHLRQDPRHRATSPLTRPLRFWQSTILDEVFNAPCDKALGCLRRVLAIEASGHESGEMFHDRRSGGNRQGDCLEAVPFPSHFAIPLAKEWQTFPRESSGIRNLPGFTLWRSRLHRKEWKLGGIGGEHCVRPATKQGKRLMRSRVCHCWQRSPSPPSRSWRYRLPPLLPPWRHGELSAPRSQECVSRR